MRRTRKGDTATLWIVAAVVDDFEQAIHLGLVDSNVMHPFSKLKVGSG